MGQDPSNLHSESVLEVLVRFRVYQNQDARWYRMLTSLRDHDSIRQSIEAAAPLVPTNLHSEP